MASEITENEDQNIPSIQEKEDEKSRIRQMIAYQKSLYFSSSSSASCSSFSSQTTSASSSKSSSLLELMREGSAPLRRLFDMEHTSLEKYFKEYSGSPLIRPILMWGTDTDDDQVHDDPWAGFREKEWRLCSNGDRIQRGKSRRRNLYRTKSYKRLPRISFWRCGRFRFKLRLIKKLRVLIRGRIF